jgi:hypothetical protein
MLMAVGGLVIIAVIGTLVMFKKTEPGEPDNKKPQQGPVIGDPGPDSKPRPPRKGEPAPDPKPRPAGKEPPKTTPPGDGAGPAVPKKPDTPDWLTNMRTELQVCDKTNAIEQVICNEKVRWKYCAPDHWNKVKECVVGDHKPAN